VCLAVSEDNPDEEGRDEIYLATCDPKSTSQNWFFDPVSSEESNINNPEREYLIHKFGEDKCLVFGANSDESPYPIASCNKEDPEQVWRICDSLTDLSKCNKGRERSTL
jgi:hypothetical protein